MNRAHVQCLEARLVALAHDAKRCELDNANVPQVSSLSEADAADADSFLADVLLCLPLIGMTVFEKAHVETAAVRQLTLKAKGLVNATGTYGPEGFVVRAGSTAAKTEVQSIEVHNR